jgi:RNA polymerase sigma-70 factor (ECF subfamily)
MPMASPTLAVEPRFESGPQSNEIVSAPDASDASCRARSFDAVYNKFASYVWRNARRLGVAPSAVEDVMQEVFLVVHRRLPEFEERTSVRAWLSAILIRVVRAHHRRRARHRSPGIDPDMLADTRSPSPYALVERDETLREFYGVLASMNEERREVLVLSELEDFTAPEIAQALGVNINTVYWRLRTARKEFEALLSRRRAAQARGAR